ncbi:MAG: hypothetical protein COV70_00315 [Parcubacteria group bacterium CG11_big_fil_rev_8_21_14_0_20_39_22]|nr:MAG: hypothetical protein COV70_00315 [Parcubacteria group bacterium CG11_big_fil_rev_8_21_14_0_20_39_22]
MLRLFFTSITLSLIPTFTVLAQDGITFKSETFGGFVNNIIGIINILIPFIIGLAVFVAAVGVFRFVGSRGSEDQLKKSKDIILYGLLAIFVMISVWGIVAIVHNTFFPKTFYTGNTQSEHGGDPDYFPFEDDSGNFDSENN